MVMLLYGDNDLRRLGQQNDKKIRVFEGSSRQPYKARCASLQEDSCEYKYKLLY
jgi:hypothetical protein